MLSFANIPKYLSIDKTTGNNNSLLSESWDLQNANKQSESGKLYAFLEFYDLDVVSEEYLTSYMILTRDKPKTYPIITKIQQISNTAKGSIVDWVAS